MSQFIRKTVLEKENYEVNLTTCVELQDDVRRATDYINQVAKQVNQTGVIYKSDIDRMKQKIEKVSLEFFIRIKKNIFHFIAENQI